MKLIFYISLICGLLYSNQSVAQKDSGELNYETFLNYVKQYHPIAIQANIIAKTGALEVLKARGSFDPLASSEVKQKYFDGTTYYDLNKHQLKIPTWFGIEGKAGFENNTGVFLNPENYTKSGLWYAGITAPIGQGLFIDKRRAMLKQAKEFSKLSEAEQKLMINNLLLDASYAYWSWYTSYREVRISEEGLQLAADRLDATKKWAVAGDRPFIDTLEANIQFLNRTISLEQAELNFNKNTFELNTFLWWENSIPLQLGDSVIPQKEMPDALSAVSLLEAGIDSINISHPIIGQQQRQLAILSIERRLKAEMLKPQLNLSYTPLAKASGDNPFTQYSINNYTWGLNFNIPIFLRKERAELHQTSLKMKAIEQKTAQKSYELYNKAKAYLVEINNLQRQITLYENNVESYRKLLAAERQKLSIGESSLFLVNSREQSYLNAQMKLVEIAAKQQQALAGLKWAVAVW